MLKFSPLSKTWLIDIDGTIVKHNGYLLDGHDTLLNGVKEFFTKLSKDDKVILLTAREEKYLEKLKAFLKENSIRYDYLLPDMPAGERILINDKKNSGLKTAFAINKDRDASFDIKYKINEDL